jgi:hypothetical protein
VQAVENATMIAQRKNEQVRRRGWTSARLAGCAFAVVYTSGAAHGQTFQTLQQMSLDQLAAVDVEV